LLKVDDLLPKDSKPGVWEDDTSSVTALCGSVDTAVVCASVLRADEGLLFADSDSGDWEDDKSYFTILGGSMDSDVFGKPCCSPSVDAEAGLLSPATVCTDDISPRTVTCETAEPAVFCGLKCFIGVDEDTPSEVRPSFESLLRELGCSEVPSDTLPDTDSLVSSDTVSSVDLAGAAFVVLSLGTGDGVRFPVLLPILPLL
jgi:hypothetical protein